MKSVEVLGFWAGDLELAISAGAVSDIGPALGEVPHIGKYLGLDSSSASESEQRVVTVQVGKKFVRVVVDGPLELWTLFSQDILRKPATIPLTSPKMLGFARRGEWIILLISAVRLVGSIG